MKYTKSQSSLEFLMIFGIAFSILINLIGVFFTYSGEAKSKLDKEQLLVVGQDIISNVEKIYFLGDGNRISMEFKFPGGIQNFSIQHVNKTNPNGPGYIQYDYLDFSYDLEGSDAQAIFTASDLYIRFNCTRCINGPRSGGNWTSYYNDTSDFSSGKKKVKIESYGDWVSIDFVK